MRQGITASRVTVLVPSFNDGASIEQTLDSIREPEPVDVVVVDDRSTDPATLALYPKLEARGCRVVYRDVNGGTGAARNTGLELARTPYVFNLDADDLLLPGVLSRLASLLDAHPDADIAYGDYEEFGARQGRRRTSAVLDPYRLAFVNKQSGLAMFRRELLEDVGCWPEFGGYEDWDLWLTLAERGCSIVHLGDVVFRYRVSPERTFAAVRRDHARIYRGLRERHPGIFGNLREHRRRSSLPWAWKAVYPLLYRGGRPRLEGVRRGVRHVVPAWSPALGRS